MKSSSEKGKAPQRLSSLDALRGFDMFFIMGGDALVASLCTLFPLSFLSAVPSQMQHAAWEGFTFYDLIFPLFLFLAGVSFSLSLAKQRSEGKSDRQISARILRRGAVLIILGMVYNGLLQFDFDHLRCASVLGRIGSAWMLASLLYVWAGRKICMFTALAILLGYWVLLAFVPAPDSVGFSPYSMEGSLAGYIDRHLLPGSLHDGIHDPEGILSTFPAIVTALIGIFVGDFIEGKTGKGGIKKVFFLAIASTALLFVGWVWGSSFPIIKNLWTSSFVCVAAGWSIALFTLFYFVNDVLGFQKGSLFFRVIGMNCITIYLLQKFIDFHLINNNIFGGVFSLLKDTPYYPLAYWIGYIALCWGLLYYLYRKETFLKV